MKAKQPVMLTATPGAWLGRMLETVCRCAAGDLKRMSATPEQSIHALRVRMKKLRALLRLAEAVVSDAVSTRLTRRMRDLKNAFTTSRETEVLQKLALRFKRQHRLPPVQLTAAPAAQSVPLRQLEKKLSALRRALAALPLESLTLSDFITAYAGRYQACRRNMNQCHASARTESFHRWRKRTREWYFLSLALHMLPSASTRISSARKLGHWLGEEHDLALLKLRVTGPSADRWRTVIAGSISRLRSRIVSKAEKLLARPRRRVRQRLKAEAARIA